MNWAIFSWLSSLLPARSNVSASERARACIGALLGIAVTATASTQLVGEVGTFAWLMAPIGASAVLLFAVPASPLAQPWAIAGGNLISGFIGVSCSSLIADPLVAAAVAVSLAIAGMFALRCLHPPSGAVALSAVLGGPAVHAAGIGFIWSPVMLNTVLLLASAVVYNNLTGRRYPHSQQLEIAHPHLTTDVVPTARLGFSRADLQRAIAEYDQVLDISADDLEQLIQRTEMLAYRRQLKDAVCGDIMSKDVVAVDYATELGDAWTLMSKHDIQALPVIDRVHRVIGIVTRSDFLHHAEFLGGHTAWKTRLFNFLQRTPHTHSSKHEVVGQIMSSPVKTVQETSPIVGLVPLMADDGFHHVPIIDSQRRLVGMVTQTDLVAALYETSVAGLKDDEDSES